MTRFEPAKAPDAAIPIRARMPRGSHLPSLVGLLVASLITFLGTVASAEDESRYDVHLFLANGRPAAKAVVRVMGPDGEMPSVTADERGSVQVGGLEPAESAFFLATSADGRESVFEPVLVVPPGHHVLTLRMYPPGYVIGELLDESGEPVKGAAVRLTGWEWLEASGLAGSATTDAAGQFRIPGLIAGAYYTVAAVQGPASAPKRTWASAPFTVYGWDGWHNVGILLPVGSESPTPRPEGTVLARLVSGTDDEWYDLADRQWRPAVGTYDPNRNWAPAPEGASWIWRAGRPDANAEKYGATVEIRKLFTVPRGKKVAGYLTIGADDYVAIRLNGHWVGQTDQFFRLASMVVPSNVLRPGQNELRLTVRNIAMTNRDLYNPTGVTYSLELITAKE